jgi:ribosomal protein L29
MKKRKKELYSELTPELLLEKKSALETDLFKLRLQSGGANLKNIKAIKYAKKDLARVLTAYNSKIKKPGDKRNNPGREG